MMKLINKIANSYKSDCKWAPRSENKKLKEKHALF